MAYKSVDHEAHVLPQRAASQTNSNVAVVVSASQADYVVPAANATAGVLLGLSIATAASPSDPVAVQFDGVGKAIAAASVGVGALVGVAAASAGGLAPVASGSNNQAVGVSRTSAAAGEYFSVLLRPGARVF
jgi:hypothetical protein